MTFPYVLLDHKGYLVQWCEDLVDAEEIAVVGALRGTPTTYQRDGRYIIWWPASLLPVRVVGLLRQSDLRALDTFAVLLCKEDVVGYVLRRNDA